MRESLMIDPKYHFYNIEGFRGNPLTDVIFPKWRSRAELSRRLWRMPAFKESDRRLPASVRSLLPLQLRTYNSPTRWQEELARLIRPQLFDAYRYRNPLTRDGQYYLYNADDMSYSLNNQDCGHNPPQIGLITALPGMGKSTSVSSVLNVLAPTVIQHSRYKDADFLDVQVIYVYHTLSSTGTMKALSDGVWEHIDELVSAITQGKVHLKRVTGSRRDIMSSLRRAGAAHHCALFVIDGIENITFSGSPNGVKELGALIRDLQMNVNVASILIGTYSAEDKIMQDFAIAERLCDGFHVEIKRFEGPENKRFVAFTNTMGKFQWLRRPVEDMATVRPMLYECSQGITRPLLNLFIAAQVLAIDSGKETIDSDFIYTVYQRHFKPIHKAIAAIERGTDEDLRKYEELADKVYRDLESTGALGNAITRSQSLVVRNIAKSAAESVAKREGKATNDRADVEMPVDDLVDENGD